MGQCGWLKNHGWKANSHITFVGFVLTNGLLNLTLVGMDPRNLLQAGF